MFKLFKPCPWRSSRGSFPVSIPRSGFWVFKQPPASAEEKRPTRFNPSVGILGVQAVTRMREEVAPSKFQSLGRDSGCSSRMLQRVRWWSWRSFNPSVGILGVQASSGGMRPQAMSEFQSLGRDSGCSSLQGRPDQLGDIWRYNPSVGILGVQARCPSLETLPSTKFQSLGRDSGCSSLPDNDKETHPLEFQSLGRDSGCSSDGAGALRRRRLPVSIPRSGFWVFKLRRDGRGFSGRCSFNPSVGILGVQACWPRAPSGGTRCFNPSVGILGVQADEAVDQAWGTAQFQSLGRDSGCSSD